MATKIKIEMIPSGFVETMRSAEVRADLKARAERIRDATGVEGFEVIETDNAGRSGALVVAATIQARRAEAKDKVLTRAIDAGRG